MAPYSTQQYGPTPTLKTGPRKNGEEEDELTEESGGDLGLLELPEGEIANNSAEDRQTDGKEGAGNGDGKEEIHLVLLKEMGVKTRQMA